MFKKLFQLYLSGFLLFFGFGEASFGPHWHQFSAAAEGACAVNNIKLLSLLNLLCNTTQTASIQMRDACYGCFFRAGSYINGPAQLTSLNDCARLYIAESQYAICAAHLQATVDGNRPTLDAGAGGKFCYSGYCDFVRCIRRINTQMLIATCYGESLGTRQLMDDLDRIYFYTNITSCILAKSRCSQYNPITGDLQHHFPGAPASPSTVVVNKVTKATGHSWIFGHATHINSLHVSVMGELRILTFPNFVNGASDLFCSELSKPHQAGFDAFNC